MASAYGKGRDSEADHEAEEGIEGVGALRCA